MQGCAWCKAGKLSEIFIEETREVDGHLFAAQLPGTRCEKCDVLIVADEGVRRFDECIAGELARAGAGGPQAFGRMRVALGLDVGQTAELCGVDAELVPLWESGRAAPGQRACALLSALLRSKYTGAECAVDGLSVLRPARGLAPRVRLVLEGAMIAAEKTLQFGSQARKPPAMA